MNIVYAFSQLLKTQECILDKKKYFNRFQGRILQERTRQAAAIQVTSDL